MTTLASSNPFLLSLFLVLAAEMGDKTQLVALAFATRFPAQTVLLGVFGATLLVHLFSVGLGELVGITVPSLWINVLAGIAFIGFGLWTLRGDQLNETDRLTEPRFSPVLTVGTTFFLAELGDKTMLMTVTLASQHHSFIAIWIGSSLGMVIADGVAIAVGRILGAQLPERLVKFGAAAIFLATGVVTLIGAVTDKLG